MTAEILAAIATARAGLAAQRKREEQAYAELDQELQQAAELVVAGRLDEAAEAIKAAHGREYDLLCDEEHTLPVLRAAGADDYEPDD